MILRGFKKYCMSSAVDESDDDRLWNGSEDDVHVRSHPSLALRLKNSCPPLPLHGLL